MGNLRTKCEDCKRLVEDYGKDKLEICDRCEHFFNAPDGELCPCRADQEARKGIVW